MKQMKATWQVFVAPEDRPTEPAARPRLAELLCGHARGTPDRWRIIDGDTYEVVNTVDTGYAVHISRMSATGRYIYVIGRDGKLALIDLWMEIPDKVAEVQTCYDARSVEVEQVCRRGGRFHRQIRHRRLLLAAAFCDPGRGDAGAASRSSAPAATPTTPANTTRNRAWPASWPRTSHRSGSSTSRRPGRSGW